MKKILLLLLSLAANAGWAENATPAQKPVLPKDQKTAPKNEKTDKSKTPASASKEGDPKAAPKPESVKEEDLVRASFEYAQDFPWKKNPPPAPLQGNKSTPPKETAPATGSGGGDMNLSGMTSGEMIIKTLGELTREQKKVKNSAGVDEDIEIMTLTKDVEIEQLEMKFVLRAQRIRITRNLSTSQLQLLEASGNVELWSPERSGRGEYLVYETQFGPHGEVLKDLYTIEGDHAKGIRATLWQGEDQVEAEKLISDRRMDTVRVLGNPVAIITMPADPATATTPAKPATPPAGGSLLPSFSMGSGGKYHIECDGEIFYEGSAGRVKLTRNVILKTESAPGQTALKLCADEAQIALNLPPPGQPNDGTSLFSGSLKTLDFYGRAEIRLPGNTMIFDRGHMDMIKNTMLMEMKDPKQEVHIYSKDSVDAPGFVYIFPKYLLYNMTSQTISAGGPQRRESFEGDPPTNRPKLGEKDKPPVTPPPTKTPAKTPPGKTGRK